jgi:zinc transport system ATP-binding protein
VNVPDVEPGRPGDPVRLAGATVLLDGRPVLSGVDLTVARGEVVCVLGSNGAGKSTLVRAVVGLQPLASGELSLFGVPAARFHDRHRIGFVPQRVGAAAGVPATVHEVVLSGRLHAIPRWRRAGAADREAVDHALEVVQLAGFGDRSVDRLSGGQQQRVLIARALAGDADLLVLDEPTSGVDLDSQDVLTDALSHLVHHHDKAILLVAHELGPLRRIVDRAVVLQAGVVVHDGPVPDHTAHEEHTHAHAEPARSSPWGLR